MTKDERRSLLAKLEASRIAASKMTPQEARAKLVAEGLLDCDGNLRPEYGGHPTQ
jgi:hypothetical protein